MTQVLLAVQPKEKDKEQTREMWSDDKTAKRTSA